MNGLRGLSTGASGAASAGTFGAGGKAFLGGPGTALGGTAANEFGLAATAGGAANRGVSQLFAKLQGMTPEQQLMMATQLAQFAAPPQMQQAPSPVMQNSYAGFMQPANAPSPQVPTLRTPLGIRG